MSETSSAADLDPCTTDLDLCPSDKQKIERIITRLEQEHKLVFPISQCAMPLAKTKTTKCVGALTDLTCFCYSYLMQQLECLHDHSDVSSSTPSLKASAFGSQTLSTDSARNDDARHEVLLAYNTELHKHLQRLKALVQMVCMSTISQTCNSVQ